MLTAQVLCTNAFYKQVQIEKEEALNNNYSNTDNIKILEKMIKALEKEINNLKNEK